MIKMLVTQALDERDLLVKKINDKIRKAKFIDSAKHNEEKVQSAKLAKAEYEKDIKADYQQIVDLIDRYKKIDAAITASNAASTIETSFGTFTVAGAIAMRSRLKAADAYGDNTAFETKLVNKMQSDYQDSVTTMDMKNRQLQDTAEQMRLSILGKDSKVKDDKPLDVVEAYVKENTTELVDPLDIRKKIDDINTMRETLLSELNTQIKVSNATTFIEI